MKMCNLRATLPVKTNFYCAITSYWLKSLLLKEVMPMP